MAATASSGHLPGPCLSAIHTGEVRVVQLLLVFDDARWSRNHTNSNRALTSTARMNFRHLWRSCLIPFFLSLSNSILCASSSWRRGREFTIQLDKCGNSTQLLNYICCFAALAKVRLVCVCVCVSSSPFDLRPRTTIQGAILDNLQASKRA